MKFALATLSLLGSTAQAWNAEYEIFIHMENTGWIRDRYGERSNI